MVNPLDCSEVSVRCPVEDSIYGYYPSLGASGFFLAFFAIAGFVNLGLGWRYRTWTYMIAMCLGCLAQVLGYAGRILLHSNPFNSTGFEIQICCLIIAPAFNSAAIYLTLKHLVKCFGRETSRLRPKYYTWVFIIADFLALCFQGAGGGIAATAGNNSSLRDIGDDLMLTGISWQVLTLLLFGIMTADYALRRRASATPLSAEAEGLKQQRKFQFFMAGLVVAYFAVFIRCVYRIAEMAGGWQNPIMQDQTIFIVLDSL
jgi:hypothetical protein